MNNRDFSNLGEEIWRTVEDAMNSMDYGQLNQRINQTVNMAMDEARRQFGRYNYNKPPHVTPPPTPHVTPDMVKNTRASKENRIQIKPVGKNCRNSINNSGKYRNTCNDSAHGAVWNSCIC